MIFCTVCWVWIMKKRCRRSKYSLHFCAMIWDWTQSPLSFISIVKIKFNLKIGFKKWHLPWTNRFSINIFICTWLFRNWLYSQMTSLHYNRCRQNIFVSLVIPPFIRHFCERICCRTVVLPSIQSSKTFAVFAIFNFKISWMKFFCQFSILRWLLGKFISIIFLS